MSDIRVLIVDDEVDFLETIVKRLQDRGFIAKGAENGEQALDYLQHNTVDTVILDVKMPGMDGLQVLQTIKLRWPLVEVIMLTGHASVESGIQGMQLGAFDYVMKPARLDDLLQKIRQAVERKKLQEEKIHRAQNQ
ncbi:MAG TPA: response regulator [Desulfonatronum sp.]|nr:response regulator [Desulfonatronum sp.]